MEFLKMKTPNLVKNNIKKLEKIFPDCVIEHSNRGGNLDLQLTLISFGRNSRVM